VAGDSCGDYTRLRSVQKAAKATPCP
jgi:hypothetical protein